MSENKIEYTLTMNSSQARSVLKAVELLMRLKINQPQEIPYAVILHLKDYCERRDKADPYLRLAFQAMFDGRDCMTIKDQEWYRLYNAYQVIRHALWEAEYPESNGVDSTIPMQLTDDEELPKISWKKVDE